MQELKTIIFSVSEANIVINYFNCAPFSINCHIHDSVNVAINPEISITTEHPRQNHLELPLPL